MIAAYYNEREPFAAQWLRNLVAAGHIAPGEVDDRDIREVQPDDVRGFTQCHFFAAAREGGRMTSELRSIGIAAALTASAAVWAIVMVAGLSHLAVLLSGAEWTQEGRVIVAVLAVLGGFGAGAVAFGVYCDLHDK